VCTPRAAESASCPGSSTLPPRGWGPSPVGSFTPHFRLLCGKVKSGEATITSQRKRTVDFTSSYLNANQGVLLSKQATAPKSLADLKQLQTCAQTNTTGLDWIKTQLHPAKQPLAFPTTTAAYQAVQINKCDALILDVPLVSLEKKQNPSKFGPVAGQVATHEQYGAVLQKGSKLLPIVNATLKTLTTDGTVGKLQKKWFNLDFSKIPVLK
jgi:polar amino acid transport system substrate-binding protein